MGLCVARRRRVFPHRPVRHQGTPCDPPFSVYVHYTSQTHGTIWRSWVTSPRNSHGKGLDSPVRPVTEDLDLILYQPHKDLGPRLWLLYTSLRDIFLWASRTAHTC